MDRMAWRAIVHGVAKESDNLVTMTIISTTAGSNPSEEME